MTEQELVDKIEARLNEMAIPSPVDGRYWITTWLAAREAVQVILKEANE